MTSLIGEFFLGYLLAVSFTDEVTFNVSTIDSLVTYQYGFESLSQALPGYQYNSTIVALWSVPKEALAPLEGNTIIVRVTAEAQNNSSISFPPQEGQSPSSFATYLHCTVGNGSCDSSSRLSAEIPVIVNAAPGWQEMATITLRSEIVPAPQEGAGAEDILSILSGIFTINSSGNGSSQNSSPFPSDLPNIPNGSLNLSGNGNFLDSLRPEQPSNDPIEFLRQNPLISIIALAIVVVITGAYLLNSKG